jgi:two-component system sensor histidine kinase BaeS
MAGGEARAVLEGWPVAATLAMALAAGQGRAARRRSSLNGAIHELRRPLQVLALSISAPAGGDRPGAGRRGASALELTWQALAELERQVNSEREAFRPRLVRCRALVEAAAARWVQAARLSGGSVTLRFGAVGVLLVADAARIGQTLDNLIANAIEHGGPAVEVDVALAGQRVRIAISGGAPHEDGLAAGAAGAPSVAASRVEAGLLRARLGGRRRRGHGLRAVAATAALHGGRLLLIEGDGGATAMLELPLAGADAAELGPAAPAASHAGRVA